MLKDIDKKYNIICAKELYEAFTYFRSGNKAILKLVDSDNNKIARYHYIKQDLGHKFLYNCENYAIKLKKLENEVCECIITKYKVEKNNEIVINRFGFIYDFINERILKYTILSNSSNTLYGDEEVIKVFK